MPFITSDIWVIFPDHQKCEKNNFGIITNSKKGKEKLLGEIKNPGDGPKMQRAYHKWEFENVFW